MNLTAICSGFDYVTATCWILHCSNWPNGLRRSNSPNSRTPAVKLLALVLSTHRPQPWNYKAYQVYLKYTIYTTTDWTVRSRSGLFFSLSVLVFTVACLFYCYIRHDRCCQDLIILPLSARRVCIRGRESQGSSCSVQPTAIGYCTWQWMAHSVLIAADITAVIGSACKGVLWRHM